MKKGIIQHFSNEEFALMMELAGGNEYALFLAGEEMDDRLLTEAFISLFQRGLLVRKEGGFELSENGAFFREIRKASHVVMIQSNLSVQRTVLLYVNRGDVWTVEIQPGYSGEQIRLSLRNACKMGEWLLDAGILPSPLLDEEDVKELGSIMEDELESMVENEAVVTISKYTTTGVQVKEYALHIKGADRLLRMSEEENFMVCIYTWEMLSKMLSQCFGG